MTNLIPKHRFEALRNGHGGVPLIGAPKQPQHQVAQLDVAQLGPVVDVIAGGLIAGQLVPIAQNERGPIFAGLPDFACYVAFLLEKWPAPLTEDQADHLALAECVARAQADATAILSRWKARHAPAEPLPEAPEAGSKPVGGWT